MKTILSLDGGGILGLMPALYLSRHPNLYEDADLLAGTSTGGLLALGLASGMPASTIVHFYRDRGPRIFNKRHIRSILPVFRSRYSAAPLNAALSDLFRDRMLKTLRKDVFITATDYYRKRNEHALVFFDRKSPFTIYDAARATSAAIGYFPLYKIRNHAFFDGGLLANNPADCALGEVRDAWHGEKIKLVSIGTGIQPSRRIDRVKRMPATYLDDAIGIAIGGNEGKTDTLLEREARNSEGRLHYIRINFLLDRSVKLDDADEETLYYLSSRADERFVVIKDTNEPE